MTNNSVDWIWLQRALGPAANLERVLSAFGNSAHALYEAGPHEWALSGVFTTTGLSKLRHTDHGRAEEVLSRCAGNGIGVLTPDDPQYPPLLRNIPTYPAVLYTRGHVEYLTMPTAVAVVGSRKPVPRALVVAADLAGTLSQCGILVVSGGALGIDSASHCGVLSAGGRTACVLGSGIGSSYLRTNEALRNEIADEGVLLTEYEPFTDPRRENFPMRNRIMAGMTAGTLVIEAGVKSGSLITARFAQEFGRSVLTVPFEDIGSVARGSDACWRRRHRSPHGAGCRRGDPVQLWGRPGRRF